MPDLLLKMARNKFPASLYMRAGLFVVLAVLGAGCAKQTAVPEVESPPPPAVTAAPAPVPAPRAEAEPEPAAPPSPQIGEGFKAPETFTVDKSMKEARTVPFHETKELSDIHFAFDKSDLDDHAKAALRAHADWLKNNPDAKLEIQGHCDDRGTNAYNLGLGERRANAAKNYLVALGIEARRIYTISYGEEKPLCLEETEECRASNRRAHFLISPTH